MTATAVAAEEDGVKEKKKKKKKIKKSKTQEKKNNESDGYLSTANKAQKNYRLSKGFQKQKKEHHH